MSTDEKLFVFIESQIKKAVDLYNRKSYREALNILNRCMRRLEKYLSGKVEGPKKLKAIALMKLVGQLQTKISETQISKIKEDYLDENELITLE